MQNLATVNEIVATEQFTEQFVVLPINNKDKVFISIFHTKQMHTSVMLKCKNLQR